MPISKASPFLFAQAVPSSDENEIPILAKHDPYPVFLDFRSVCDSAGEGKTGHLLAKAARSTQNFIRGYLVEACRHRPETLVV